DTDRTTTRARQGADGFGPEPQQPLDELLEGEPRVVDLGQDGLEGLPFVRLVTRDEGPQPHELIGEHLGLLLDARIVGGRGGVGVDRVDRRTGHWSSPGPSPAILATYASTSAMTRSILARNPRRASSVITPGISTVRYWEPSTSISMSSMPP